MSWNFFRYLADVCHAVSTCILIGQIHINRSAEGVSLITQSFYLVVSCCRYLPYPITVGPDPSGLHLWWNLVLKLFYIFSSLYILFLMLLVFARTRERESAWKLGAAVFFGSLAAAPLVMFSFQARTKGAWSIAKNSWIFSTVLESVAVLPQLQLLRQTSVPTVIDSYYLIALGLYRFWYIINWIVQGARHKSVDTVAVVFGVVQTLIFFDFFWVYWSRQRVKLRGGQVIDSEDLSKGWLVKRLIGRHKLDEQEPDEEYGRVQTAPGVRRTWGARGISVSADEGLHDGAAGGDDGERLAAPEAFEDDVDDDAAERPGVGDVGDGSEWLDRADDDGDDRDKQQQRGKV